MRAKCVRCVTLCLRLLHRTVAIKRMYGRIHRKFLHLVTLAFSCEVVHEWKFVHSCKSYSKKSVAPFLWTRCKLLILLEIWKKIINHELYETFEVENLIVDLYSSSFSHSLRSYPGTQTNERWDAVRLSYNTQNSHKIARIGLALLRVDWLFHIIYDLVYSSLIRRLRPMGVDHGGDRGDTSHVSPQNLE